MRIWSVGALGALVVSAVAQTPIPHDVQQSVLGVIATAIPRESASYALASQSAFAAEMGSSLAAGKTPAWYQALPSDVKSLLPAIYPANATPTPSASASTSASALAFASTQLVTSSVGTARISARPTGVNSTSISSVRAPTLSASGSPARSSAPAQATGAASMPSAALGAGIGAALGFLGMLAL